MKKPFALLWLLFSGVVIFSWVYLPSLSKYHDLKLQEDELDKQIEKYSTEVETIKEERDLLKNDPEYLEKVIRDELGLVKPGEIVYKFVQDPPGKVIPEEMSDELSTPDPELPEVALPSPVSISSGITVEAKPVAATAARTPIKTIIRAVSAPLVSAPKKLPPPDAEPVYPRRETR